MFSSFDVLCRHLGAGWGASDRGSEATAKTAKGGETGKEGRDR